MKTSLRSAALAASISFLICNTAPAQAPAGRSASSDRIAVIDINYIFKNHTRFGAMVEDWKGDVQKAEDGFRGERTEIQAMAEDIKRFKPGQPDYKRLEEDIARRQSDLQVRMQLKKKGLMEREAKMYMNVYSEVQEQVQYFAQRHGITMVLRFNRNDVTSDDPRQIQQALLRPVVFQDNIDITVDILQRLNPPGSGGNPQERNAAAPSRSQVPGRPGTR